MPKPSQGHLESDEQYAWRLAVEHPDRYPLNLNEHEALIRKKVFWFEALLSAGRRTRFWRPFIWWARRNGLA